MKIGKNLKELRESRKTSISDLANTLNVDDKTIENWEQDQSVPDMNQLIEISKNLSIDIDELLKDRIEDEPIDSTNDEKLVFIAGKSKFFDLNLNENELTNNIYRRQKMLVKLSSIILLIYFIILCLLSVFIILSVIVSLFSFSFSGFETLMILGMIILTYYTFKRRIKLFEISNYDDFKFIQSTNVILKIGLVLSIFFLVIPGFFLIVVYFTTDSEKYFKSKKFDVIYSKLINNKDISSIQAMSTDDLLKEIL